MEPLPSLKQSGDVDALLRGDLIGIIVDAEDYMDDRSVNRIRFSIAHELGHFVLHKEIYQKISFTTVDEWVEFVQEIPEREYSFMEFHANEFAGRLLVPRDQLQVELDKAMMKAKEAGFADLRNSEDVAREYVANSICRIFGVSSQVIERRIRYENLWQSDEI